MKKLTREHAIFAMDKNNPTVLTIESGERIILETEDCFSHQIVSDDMVLGEDFDHSRINPATGPVFVSNCSRGDVLEMNIAKIEVDSQGVVELYPGWARLEIR